MLATTGWPKAQWHSQSGQLILCQRKKLIKTGNEEPLRCSYIQLAHLGVLQLLQSISGAIPIGQDAGLKVVQNVK